MVTRTKYKVHEQVTSNDNIRLAFLLSSITVGPTLCEEPGSDPTQTTQMQFSEKKTSEQ